MKSSSKSSSTASRVGKKTKVTWTKDLHNKFLEAIGKLGIDNAVPKKIVELMKVEGLTRDQVASHLQKYRILSKKIANANDCVQTSLKPSLLESSMTNGVSWSNSLLMLNQEQTKWAYYCGMHAVSPLVLDTSSSCFPVLEASNFMNSTNEGYSMQRMTTNLDEQRNFKLVKSSNSGFVQNLDGYFYDNGGCSKEVQIYNSFDMGSLASSVQYSSNFSFVHNSNGLGSNYTSTRELVEIGSLYDADSNNHLENRLGEDDLKLSEVDIAYISSFVDDNNLPVNLEPPIQDVNGQNFANSMSFYSEDNEEPISVDQHQALDGNLPGFNPTFKLMDERFMEPIWSPEPCVDDMTLHSLILNSYVA